MYPLRFEPLFRRYIWGGRRLHEVLNKPIGDEAAAESWEIVDHHDDQSIVRFGELAGHTLRQLIAQSGKELLGESLMENISAPEIPSQLRHRFPLLLKFLDANRNLSVQVHPNDELGATLDPPDLGKTEAWYVMHADPGAKIFAGLKPGVTQQDFRNAIANGQTESALHSFEPKQGDCVFIPAGTMHAIGAGLLVAEIQQSSNTTFRVFDWNRVDDIGNARPLHIEKAIQATDFNRGPVNPETPKPTDDSSWVTIVACDKFVMNLGSLSGVHEIGGDGKLRILAVTRGSVMVKGDPSNRPLRLGETMLLPASLGAIDLTAENGGAEVLEIFVPAA